MGAPGVGAPGWARRGHGPKRVAFQHFPLPRSGFTSTILRVMCGMAAPEMNDAPVPVRARGCGLGGGTPSPGGPIPVNARRYPLLVSLT